MNENQKWENSIEYIMNNLSVLGECTTTDATDKLLIAQTIQRLPRKIREKVLDEVLFIILRACGTVEEIVIIKNERDIKKTKMKDGNNVIQIKQPVIILNFSEMKKSKSSKMSTIAHEIAHFILKHYEPKKGEVNVEKEADDLIERWGFERCYRSYYS